MKGLAERGLETILKELRIYASGWYANEPTKVAFWEGYQQALEDVRKKANE